MQKHLWLEHLDQFLPPVYLEDYSGFEPAGTINLNMCRSLRREFLVDKLITSFPHAFFATIDLEIPWFDNSGLYERFSYHNEVVSEIYFYTPTQHPLDYAIIRTTSLD